MKKTRPEHQETGLLLLGYRSGKSQAQPVLAAVVATLAVGSFSLVSLTPGRELTNRWLGDLHQAL